MLRPAARLPQNNRRVGAGALRLPDHPPFLIAPADIGSADSKSGRSVLYVYESKTIHVIIINNYVITTILFDNNFFTTNIAERLPKELACLGGIYAGRRPLLSLSPSVTGITFPI